MSRVVKQGLCLLFVAATLHAQPVCLNGTQVAVCVDVARAADGAVYLSAFNFAADDTWVVNLAQPAAGSGVNDFVSLGTLLTSSSPNQLYSRLLAGGTVTKLNATAVGVSGIYYGDAAAPVATESWVVVLETGSQLTWVANRTYQQGTSVLSDRLAITVSTLGVPPVYGSQIPGYLNEEMFLNESTGAGFIAHGSSSPQRFYEFLTPLPVSGVGQLLKFEPSNIPFNVSASVYRPATPSAPVFFSFAKPYQDGTSQTLSFGVQSIDRRSGGGVAVTAGDVQVSTLTLQRLSADDATLGLPTLNLTLPNATLQELIAQFVSVQNMWNGWIFGNNPASVPCLHEMSWFALIAGMFPAGAAPHSAVAREFEYIGKCGWDDGSGQPMCSIGNHSLMQRWASSGFYNCQWGPLADQAPHFIIGAHAAALATGNATFLRAMLPAMEALAGFLRVNGVDSGGVFLVPGASGLADGGHHTSNWYDVIEFGHADAFLNALCVWAMTAMSDAYAWLGDAAHAAEYAGIASTMQRAFKAAFWNATAAQSADWIDVDGHARWYLFTDIAFLSVMTGTVTDADAVAAMRTVDTRVAALAAANNITRDDIWAMPCSLFPVTNPLEVAIPVSSPVPFPSYENGGSFFHTIGFEVVARGIVGDAAGAYASFERFLQRGFVNNRAWAQQLYWADGTLVGFDPLNNALLALWGFLRACFGFTLSLAGGLTAVGTPAPQCEGALYTLSLLGEPTCVRVTAGQLQRC